MTSTENCNYTFQPSEFTFPRPELEANSCQRKVWNGSENCILHTNSEDKPVDDVVRALNDEFETRGAIFKKQSLPDGESIVNIELDLAVFKGTNLNKIEFRGVTLEDANFNHVNAEGVAFEKCILESTSFEHASLENVSFKKGIMTAANFYKAKLKDVVFFDLRLDGNIHSEAELYEVDFSKARNMEHTVFENADTSRADFSGRDLKNANFEGARLFLAEMPKCRLTAANFYNSDLKSANLEKATLSGANFTRANLRDAKLDGAILSDTDFRDVRVSSRTDFGRWCLSERIADYNILEGGERNILDYRIDTSWLDNWERPHPLISFFRPLYAKSNMNSRSYSSAVSTYRMIQRILQANGLPDQVRYYRIREQHARRKEAMTAKDYFGWFRLGLSRWTSLYTESYLRVIGASIFTILFSSFLYPFWGIQYSSSKIIHYSTMENEVFGTALTSLYFSIVTFTTLGYGDFQPIGLSRIIASLESFIGGLLMAFLVFVLGKRASQ